MYNNEYLDSRDLEVRIDELQSKLIDEFNDEFPTKDFLEVSDVIDELNSNDSLSHETFKTTWEDELEELEKILELKDEVCSSEWDFGITFIHEAHFEEYIIEFIEDCGYISRDFPNWIEIDWKATADNVSVDYSEVEFMGCNWYYRG